MATKLSIFPSKIHESSWCPLYFTCADRKNENNGVVSAGIPSPVYSKYLLFDITVIFMLLIEKVSVQILFALAEPFPVKLDLKRE